MNINENKKVTLDFFTPVFFEKDELQKQHPLTQIFIRVGQAADYYLSFEKSEINASKVEKVEVNTPLWKTALKIASYIFTCGILPLFALIPKLIYKNYCESIINEKKQKTVSLQKDEQKKDSITVLGQVADEIPTIKLEEKDPEKKVSETTLTSNSINQQVSEILSRMEDPETSNEDRLKGYLEISRFFEMKIDLSPSNASRIEALKQKKLMVTEKELREQRPEAVVITKKRRRKSIPKEWRTTVTELIAKTSRLPGANVLGLSENDKKIVLDAGEAYPAKLDDMPNRKPIESRTESNRVLVPLAFNTKEDGFTHLTKGMFDKSKASAITPDEPKEEATPDTTTTTETDKDEIYATTVVREDDAIVEDASEVYGTFVAH